VSGEKKNLLMRAASEEKEQPSAAICTYSLAERVEKNFRINLRALMYTLAGYARCLAGRHGTKSRVAIDL
jgi:hypothetical protein